MSVTIHTGTPLFYRSLEPLDESALYRACAHREPRPSYADCVELLSTQLAHDDSGTDNYFTASAGVVRRLLAVFGKEPAGLVSMEIDDQGHVLVIVDPIALEHAGSMEIDAVVWAEHVAGLDKEFTIAVVAGMAHEQLPRRPLTFAW